MLKIAFKRRLIFTIGDSATSDEKNIVIWNNIQHKTQLFGGPQAYGYPDPNYLNKVQSELANFSIDKNLLNKNFYF